MEAPLSREAVTISPFFYIIKLNCLSNIYFYFFVLYQKMSITRDDTLQH